MGPIRATNRGMHKLQKSSASSYMSKKNDGSLDCSSNSYPYPVDYCDHFETSLAAYRDVKPLLSGLSAVLGRKEAKLKIYDPYYCAGSTVNFLNSKSTSITTPD